MKKLLLLFISLNIIASCGRNNADQRGEQEDSTEVAENRFIWQATLNDTTGRLEMKHAKSDDTDPLSIQSVIESTNQSNPEIILSFLKTSHDTAYLKIVDAHFLTRQMGSSGATMYIAALVYNLTEIPNINYVNMDFEEGDHAAPGTFTRDTFKDQ